MQSKLNDLQDGRRRKEQVVSEKQNFNFSRLKVSLALEEVDYDSQIQDCKRKLVKTQEKLHNMRVINYRTYQETQVHLESSVAELINQDYS